MTGMSTVNSTWRLAVPAVRAHRVDLAGTALVLAAAGAVVSLTGVLMESGLRGDGGMLSALASSFAGTALVVVLIVVTSTVGLVMRQRRGELALMRTIGATASQVRGLVSTEVLLVSLVAVPFGAVPGLWLASTLTPMLDAAGMVGPGRAPGLRQQLHARPRAGRHDVRLCPQPQPAVRATCGHVGADDPDRPRHRLRAPSRLP